ncbi:MAG TPA: LptF/LptG family permease [Candidatus Omnitrophota bacterium]|nr:LptF/LptG family permease [Candidatus Omnitrophota bacterium]
MVDIKAFHRAAHIWAMPRPRFNVIDRYLLSEAVRPLAATLTVVMAALLMERMLRLFRLVTGGGGPLDLVAWMALNLVPHYLGLAIPAALFLAVYLVIGRLGADNETDALRGAGVSLRRAVRSLLLLGMALGVVNLVVVGWLQPHGRYQYRALVHAVSQAVWDALLPERTLVRVAEGTVLSAEQVLGDGRIAGVFVRQEKDGAITVTTARQGRLVLTDSGGAMRIDLAQGVLARTEADGTTRSLAFTQLSDVVTVRVAPEAFRPRGQEERELTLPELAQPHAAIPQRRLDAELHARLARAITVPFIPMLAVGVGIAAKRSRRGLGLGVGAVALFVFHHLLLTGEGMAEAGRMAVVPAIWAPVLAFALVCLGAFLRLDRRPGDPVLGVVR